MVELDKDLGLGLLCRACAHLQSIDQRRCKAFPEGIPIEIWTSVHDHRKPFDGDGGVVFEKKD